MTYVNDILLRAMTLARRVRDEVGQDTIEWAMLSGLIALGIIAVVGLLTGALTDMINGVGDCIDFNGLSPCLPGGLF